MITIEWIMKNAKYSNIYIMESDTFKLNEISYKIQTDYCLIKYKDKNKNNLFLLPAGNVKFDKVLLCDYCKNLNVKLKKHITPATDIVILVCDEHVKSCKSGTPEKLLKNQGYKIIKKNKNKTVYKVRLNGD